MFGVICNEKSETGKDEKGLEGGGGGGTDSVFRLPPVSRTTVISIPIPFFSQYRIACKEFGKSPFQSSGQIRIPSRYVTFSQITFLPNLIGKISDA